ncbi:DUF1611 domain-containing protein [Halolamina sp.]|jgi:uncharacterized NAD-dependent epimerase/dehydratase family protein|uniref:DUF1611 domain-containing protein n=1 Tax=Halolamina sp. TaxID=1940283 RepID=UPI000223B95E|nr:protein of unknown function DUF1611 [halophilic archaeon DL31]
MSQRRIAVLAHEKFPGGAKTALGVMRYSDDETVAVIDRDTAGDRVADHETTVPDAPIVDSFDAVEGAVDALLIGIAPIGGGFDDSWRSDVVAALEQGVDVVAGLHYFLSEDEEFAALAAEHGAELHDVRKPHPGIGVAEGRSADIDAEVVLTVGTDCSVGKMTATCELVDTAQKMGIDAGFIPTGQTGIMIAGWGNPVDRVVSDFTAGAVEEMLLEKGDEYDVLFVEGQGSIIHPAYSAVTCGILHGAMADKLVLCHEAGREVVHGYEETVLPPVSEYVDLYESLAAPVHETEVVGGAINTSQIETDDSATAAVEEYADEIGGTATDPIRFGCEELVEELVGEFK